MADVAAAVRLALVIVTEPAPEVTESSTVKSTAWTVAASKPVIPALRAAVTTSPRVIVAYLFGALNAPLKLSVTL